MKKLTKIMAVAAVIFCGALVTACGLFGAVKEYIDSTHGTWFKYNGSSLEVPFGTDDNSDSSASTNTLKNADIYVYYDHGLTVAVQTVTQTDIDLLGGLVTSRQDVVVGATKTYTEEDFNSAKWTLLLAAANFKQQESAPTIVADPDRCVIIGGDNIPNFKIQWKKFLKEKIVEYLLG